jgi:hypothetical protein
MKIRGKATPKTIADGLLKIDCKLALTNALNALRLLYDFIDANISFYIWISGILC